MVGVLSTAFGYSIMNTWQPKVAASEAGLIYCLEPVWASVYALFLPGLLFVWTGVAYADETLTAKLVSGALLILGANVVLQVRWTVNTAG